MDEQIVMVPDEHGKWKDSLVVQISYDYMNFRRKDCKLVGSHFFLECADGILRRIELSNNMENYEPGTEFTEWRY